MTYLLWVFAVIGALVVIAVLAFAVWFSCTACFFNPLYWYCRIFHRIEIVEKSDLAPYGIGGQVHWKARECQGCGRSFGRISRL